MANIKLTPGDAAKVVESKSHAATHFFPFDTVVRIGKRYKEKRFGFSLFYCTAVDGPLKGVTQLVATNNLEKIEQ